LKPGGRPKFGAAAADGNGKARGLPAGVGNVKGEYAGNGVVPGLLLGLVLGLELGLGLGEVE
jgi:hypothetical protein